MVFWGKQLHNYTTSAAAMVLKTGLSSYYGASKAVFMDYVDVMKASKHILSLLWVTEGPLQRYSEV